MRLALLAAGLMVIVAVGLYMGLSGFQQYALETSRSKAELVVCAPDRPVTTPGRTVIFSASGLPAGQFPQWSAPEGTAAAGVGGTLNVSYSTRGEKTVFAFFRIGDLWQRAACTVSVQ